MLKNAIPKKVVFIQDDYRRVNDIIKNLNFMNVDILYTCVPTEEIENVFPYEKLPNLKKINVLTGFVPENLKSYKRKTYHERSLDVVYRARKVPAWLGRLGQEKWMIAEIFSRDAVKYGLKTNISCLEEDRIYGDAWIEFLSNAKAVLGCETGASVFDFTGDIQKNAEEFEKKYPLASFEEIEKKFFEGLDGKIRLNQISPRCFECAALGTLMILYKGDYSGILKPWRHYLPLEKNHSNMQEIIKFLKSPQKWQEITDQAYTEIALNKQYSYENFIKEFDLNLAKLFQDLSSKSTDRDESNIVFSLEPRVISRYGHHKTQLILFLDKNLKFFLRSLPNRQIIWINDKLRQLIRPIILSLKNLKQLLYEKDFYHILFFLNQQFCFEYKLINSIKSYAYFMRKYIGIMPLDIKLISQSHIKIKLSCEKKENHDFHLIKIGKASIYEIICEDSIGLPDDLRGRRHILKYKNLINNLASL